MKKVNPKTTAMVLIEMQNDFLSPQGKLNSLVSDVVQATNIVENVNTAVRIARDSQIPILWAPIEFSEDYREMGEDPYGILKVVKDHNAFVKESWGAQLFEDIDVQPHDIKIQGKSSISAFAGTNLDTILKENGIDTIILGGFLSHVCVTATMTSAYDNGYDVITLVDAVATAGMEAQNNVIAQVYPMFSTPVKVNTLSEMIHPEVSLS